MVSPSTPSAQSKVTSSSEEAHTAAAHPVHKADVKSMRIHSANSPATIKAILAADIIEDKAAEMVIVDTPSVSPDIPKHPRTTANDSTMTDILPNRAHIFDDTQLVETTVVTATGHIIDNVEVKTFDADTMNPVKLEFAPSTIEPSIRQSTEGKVFIKKEYLSSPAKSIVKPEKTREEVTRFLNFGQPEECTSESDVIPTLASADDIKPKDIIHKSYRIPETSKETDIKKSLSSKHKSHLTEVPKGDNKLKNTPSTSLDPSSSSKDKTKSQSSSRRSSSSSNRDCSRCYKRSKIKRTNVGIQCTRSSPDTSSCSKPIDPLTQPTENCGAYPMRDLHCPLDKLNPAVGLKYERFFHIEVHTNGGASVVHLYQDEINELTPEEMDELVDEFFLVAFSEDPEGSAHHVMGIVHDAAGYLPDLLEHMSENYSTLTVKAGVMGRNSDIETSTMYQYNEQVIILIYYTFKIHLIIHNSTGCKELFTWHFPLRTTASNQSGRQGS